MQSSAEALIQTITGHSNSTADLLILTQQFIHLVDENLTRHRTTLQAQNNDLQQFKERTRKRLRDQDEVIEKALTRIVTLETKLDQTTKLATRALKRAKRSNSPPPQPVLVQSPEPIASSSRLVSLALQPLTPLFSRDPSNRTFPLSLKKGKRAPPLSLSE